MNAPTPTPTPSSPAWLAVARTRRLARRGMFAMVGAVLLAGVLVPCIANAYWLKTLTSALALSMAAAGVALLYGQLGLVSLCQYALLGLGGWIALRVAHGLQWPFELCVLAGGLGAAAIGVVAGLPALRLKGLYLALGTLMMAGIVQVALGATGFPDGGAGWLGRVEASERQMMPRPAWGQSDAAYFLYVAAWLAGVLALIAMHRHSRAGRAWALMRKGEAAALGAGVHILLYQSWAFGLAGFCAGVAGSLLAGSVGQLDGRAFTASESVMLFVLTVVGGAYHWVGALAAGLLLRAVPAMLSDFNVNGFVATMLYGAALLHALISAPQGIAGQIAGARAGWAALRHRHRHRHGRQALRPRP